MREKGKEREREGCKREGEEGKREREREGILYLVHQVMKSHQIQYPLYMSFHCQSVVIITNVRERERDRERKIERERERVQ